MTADRAAALAVRLPLIDLDAILVEAGIACAPRPVIEIIESDPVPGNPSKDGAFGVQLGRPTIRLRRPDDACAFEGLLRHEVWHYVQELRGDRHPFNEVEAKAFANAGRCTLHGHPFSEPFRS